MNGVAQNIVNEWFASKILQNKDLRLNGGMGVVPVLGTGRYCLWLINTSILTSVSERDCGKR